MINALCQFILLVACIVVTPLAAAIEHGAARSAEGDADAARVWPGHDVELQRDAAEIKSDYFIYGAEHSSALFLGAEHRDGLQPRHLRYYSMHGYFSQSWLHPRSLYYHEYFY